MFFFFILWYLTRWFFTDIFVGSLDYWDSYHDKTISLVNNAAERNSRDNYQLLRFDPPVLRSSNGAHVQHYFVLLLTNTFVLHPSIVVSIHTYTRTSISYDRANLREWYKVYKIASLSKLLLADYIFDPRKFYLPTIHTIFANGS